MTTLALYGLLAVLLIGAIYLVAAWLLPAGEQIAAPVRDEPIWSLPAERPLVPADVADVRLPVALRGYRFAETDLLLDRLVEELSARDDEIARLRKPSTPLGAESEERLAQPEVPAAPASAGQASTSLAKSTPKPEVEAPAGPATDAVAAAAAKTRAESPSTGPKPAAAPNPAPASETKPPAPPTEPGGHDG